VQRSIGRLGDQRLACMCSFVGALQRLREPPARAVLPAPPAGLDPPLISASHDLVSARLSRRAAAALDLLDGDDPGPPPEPVPELCDLPKVVRRPGRRSDESRTRSAVVPARREYPPLGSHGVSVDGMPVGVNAPRSVSPTQPSSTARSKSSAFRPDVGADPPSYLRAARLQHDARRSASEAEL
jgi:hypothetical protein